MINFEHSIIIDRTIEDVFAFLIKPENEVQWQAGLVESKQASEGQMGVGARGRDVRKFMGREVVTVWEVTRFEPNHMFEFRVISGPVPFTGTYMFIPMDSATKVTVTAQATLTGISKLIEPVIAHSGKKQYDVDFLTLKKVLEA